jgi:thioredoxin-like negative regulator of GroEL
VSDVDGNPQTPITYSVKSIPSLLLFEDGKLLEQFKGTVLKQVIVDKLPRAAVQG